MARGIADGMAGMNLNASSSAPSAPLCAKKHPMISERVSLMDEASCDICGREIVTKSMWTCDPCDYVLCNKCGGEQMRNAKNSNVQSCPPPVAEVPPQKVSSSTAKTAPNTKKAEAAAPPKKAEAAAPAEPGKRSKSSKLRIADVEGDGKIAAQNALVKLLKEFQLVPDKEINMCCDMNDLLDVACKHDLIHPRDVAERGYEQPVAAAPVEADPPKEKREPRAARVKARYVEPLPQPPARRGSKSSGAKAHSKKRSGAAGEDECKAQGDRVQDLGLPMPRAPTTGTDNYRRLKAVWLRDCANEALPVEDPSAIEDYVDDLILHMEDGPSPYVRGPLSLSGLLDGLADQWKRDNVL